MKLPTFLQDAPLMGYESHMALGCFAPVPFGAVELSEQYASLQRAGFLNAWNLSGAPEMLARAYLMYRLGRI